VIRANDLESGLNGPSPPASHLLIRLILDMGMFDVPLETPSVRSWWM
jgi:hypothetical protein